MTRSILGGIPTQSVGTISLAYSVANAIFGGSAEYVALSLKAWAFLFSLRLPKQAKYLHNDL